MKKNKLGVIIYDNFIFLNSVHWGFNSIKKDNDNYSRLHKLYRRKIMFKTYGIKLLIKRRYFNNK